MLERSISLTVMKMWKHVGMNECAMIFPHRMPVANRGTDCLLIVVTTSHRNSCEGWKF